MNQLIRINPADLEQPTRFVAMGLGLVLAKANGLWNSSSIIQSIQLYDLFPEKRD